MVARARSRAARSVFIASVLSMAALVGGLGYYLARQASHRAEERKLYPFEAYLNGQALMTDNIGPIRFRTRKEADRYVRDYAATP